MKLGAIALGDSVMFTLLLTLVLGHEAELRARPLDARDPAAVVARLAEARANWVELQDATQALAPLAKAVREADVQRLTAALHLAAQAPQPLTPGDESCASEARASDCMPSLGPCLSRAGYLADALEPLGTRAAAAGPDALRLLEVGGPSEKAIARRLLAAMQHPRAEQEILALFSRERSLCKGEASRLLGMMKTWSPDAQRTVQRLGASSGVELDLATMVSARPEPWVAPLVLQWLQGPSSHARLGALRGLTARRPLEPALGREVQRLAACDPWQQLRTEAKQTLKQLKLGRGETRCTAQWAGRGRVVETPEGPVTLGESPGLPAPTPECVKAAEGLRALGMLGDECLVGLDRGEWGGALLLWKEGQLRLVAADPALNPRFVLRRGDDLLVLAGVDHGLGSGHLFRLRSDAGTGGDAGTGWKLERLLDLPVRPVAWALHRDTLFVALLDSHASDACERARGEVIYALDPSLKLELVATEATACLHQIRP